MAQRLPGEGCHLRGDWVLTPLLTFRKRPSPISPCLLFFLLSLVSMSAFPLSAIPQVEGNKLVPGAKEPNNKYLYFPLFSSLLNLEHFNMPWISISLSQLSFGLGVHVFFPPISCFLSLSAPSCLPLSTSTMSIAIQYLYSVVCQEMHMTSLKCLVYAEIHS